jgi:hypothetical protein
MQSLLFFLTIFALAAGLVSLAIRVLKKPPYFDAIFFGCAITFFVSSTAVALFPAAKDAWLHRREKAPERETFVSMSPDAAAQMAVAEVKRREGWAGKADRPTLFLGEAEVRLYVTVRHKPCATRDWRNVTIDAMGGKIIGYDVRTDPLP